MASLAVTAARTRLGRIPDRKVAAYAAPTAPANITHDPITKAEAGVKTLSPVHPLNTVKEA